MVDADAFDKAAENGIVVGGIQVAIVRPQVAEEGKRFYNWQPPLHCQVADLPGVPCTQLRSSRRVLLGQADILEELRSHREMTAPRRALAARIRREYRTDPLAFMSRRGVISRPSGPETETPTADERSEEIPVPAVVVVTGKTVALHTESISSSPSIISAPICSSSHVATGEAIHQKNSSHPGIPTSLNVSASAPIPRILRSRRKKLLQFWENYRPAWWGVWADIPAEVSRPRKPLDRYSGVDYEADSEQEWGDDAEDGEDCGSDDDDDANDDEVKAVESAVSTKRRRADGLVEDEGFLLPESEDEDALDSVTGERKRKYADAFEPVVLGPVTSWHPEGKNTEQLVAMRELEPYCGVIINKRLWELGFDLDLPVPSLPKPKRQRLTPSNPATKTLEALNAAASAAMSQLTTSTTAVTMLQARKKVKVASAPQSQPVTTPVTVNATMRDI